MRKQSSSREIIVSATLQEAYQALTCDFDKWWSDSSRQLFQAGDVTTFHFHPNPTTWTFRANVLQPQTYIELECIEAHHIHEGLPESILEEWKGTKLKWNIAPDDKGTKISFTHEGLTPELDCHEICEQGWDHFFLGSLKNYL